jgi:hypothetical protein
MHKAECQRCCNELNADWIYGFHRFTTRKGRLVAGQEEEDRTPAVTWLCGDCSDLVDRVLGAVLEQV